MKKKIAGISFIIIVFLTFLFFMFFNKNFSYTDIYLKSNKKNVDIYDNNFNKIGDITRGTNLKSNGKIIKNKDQEYIKVMYEDDYIYINKKNINIENKDLILEDTIYVRTPAVIYKDSTSSNILYQLKKGEKLDIVGYDKILNDGEVNMYKVKYNDITGYVYSKYLAINQEYANSYYKKEKYHDVHAQMGDSLGAGNAGDLDYFPVEKPKFSDNKMPNKVYSLYLNGGKDVISNVDSYIEFAKTTKINSFVVDIKDNEAPAYNSKVMEKYSKTSYNNALNTIDEYKSAIKKIKDAGFYVIGRITTFKDLYYTKDNPNDAIIDNMTKQPLLHSNTYWPSPFKRNVWMYNIELAKEAVKEFGFNEIQFDYVRFPDRVRDLELENKIDYNNEYDETKSQAIQRFLMYACDELHKLNVYVSVDVFGESAHKYVTAYGQYYPAISNVVDVISAMPYPDHFSTYEYGFTNPVFTEPYKILNYWAKEYAYKRRSEVPTPAIDRTWIQAYDVPNYKYSGGFKYGSEQVEAEIKGLFDGGLVGGYMTWNSTSDLEKYKSQKDAYSKEY